MATVIARSQANELAKATALDMMAGSAEVKTMSKDLADVTIQADRTPMP